MTNGPYRIQSQGRLFQIGEETGIQQGEHGEGTGRKAGKNQSWKHRSKCQNCCSEFAGRPGAANRFCRSECQHEFSVNRWLACSKCLAAVGLGCKKASRLLGVTASTVTRQWKGLGIVAATPENGSWKATISKGITEKERNEKKFWDDYHREWMKEIRSHCDFPDWSSLFKPKRKISNENKAKANDKYHAMTEEEKKERNARCQMLRKIRHQSNPESKARDQQKINDWKKRNPEKNRESIKNSIKKRKIIDPGFRVQCNLRNRLKEVMGQARKGGTHHTNSLTGCSTKDLARHLESKFKRGMTWGNYGTKWHVDHILPCAAFDHNDPKQVAQCWHWTNLHPLCAKKNLEKSDSITEPQMSLLLCATH